MIAFYLEHLFLNNLKKQHTARYSQLYIFLRPDNRVNQWDEMPETEICGENYA